MKFALGFCAVLAMMILLNAGAPASAATTGTAEASQASPFAIRGLKGLWWEGAEKYQQALPWMASHKMNWLMLCYTMYPESARKWREDFTPQHMQEIRSLVTRGNDLGVTLCLSFNPGIWSNPPLCHSCDADYQAAWRKIRAGHSVGIRWFALCLDDIAKQLVPADRDRYGSLAAAQMDFVNRLYADLEKLDPSAHMIFCPSAYTSKEMQKHADYTAYVKEHLAPGIDIFWTGPEVCSPRITVEDARAAAEAFGRKPFVWDNYPVNDMYPWRPLLAPVKGRAADLAPEISGILFNPMKQWNLNRLPLVSVADYLDHPATYDPAAERERTLANFDEADRPALGLLLDYYGSTFWGDPGFPPGVKITDMASAQKAAADLARLKALMTSGSATLQAMWKEASPTIEADLAEAEQMARGPVVMGSQFKGGGPELARRGFGFDAGLVYARSTGKNRVVGELPVEDTSGTVVLRLMARNGDRQKPRVRIELNDVTLAEGLTDFSQSTFEMREFPVPAEARGAASPWRLEVENLESSGTAGMPPWFAVKWAQVESR